MNDIIARTSSAPIVPVPASPIAIRVATMADLPFMDGLQKRFNRALGYFPTKQFEGYIEMGGVLVAEEAGSRQRAAGSEEIADGASSSSLPTARCPLPTCLGYVISRDRYLKRDELGVVYQLCVAPGHQRGLIGAALVKAVFDRAAYGCRLFCCWCAQDLAANHFWESLGFVPIAFRAGSTGKKRVHIFWQRRVHSHPVTPSPHHPVTPYWYPSQTNSGAIREDRLVFPIPPGVHWRDIRPPDIRPAAENEGKPRAPRALTQSAKAADGEAVRERKRTTRHASQVAAALPVLAPRSMITRASALRFGPPPAPTPALDGPTKGVRPNAPRAKEPAAKACPERSRRIDPAYLKAARELRDRWMERVNDSLVLPAMALGKYDVSRILSAVEGSRSLDAKAKSTPLLAAG